MRGNKLQSLCREYLGRLKPIANKHGLCEWIDNIINDNKQNKCVATEEEVMFLSRCVDEERISRTEIPHLLGKSYRHCFENDLFDKIKKLPHVCIYSRVSALLFNEKQKNDYGSKNKT